MSQVNVEIHELPARFAEVVALSASGEDVFITEGGVPRARLLSLLPTQPRIAGLHPGAMETADDFDAPLSDDFWTGKS
jgi:antitoxin (DNA-binding transcriptional repressor) of toxin-antitoxin stability system